MTDWKPCAFKLKPFLKPNASDWRVGDLLINNSKHNNNSSNNNSSIYVYTCTYVYMYVCIYTLYLSICLYLYLFIIRLYVGGGEVGVYLHFGGLELWQAVQGSSGFFLINVRPGLAIDSGGWPFFNHH